jgi:hypothetical protein
MLLLCSSVSFAKKNWIDKEILKCSQSQWPIRAKLDGKLGVSCKEGSDFPKMLDSESYCLSSRYFTIVENINDTPLCFKDWKNQLKTPSDRATLLRAATVYWHLHYALKYVQSSPWLQELSTSLGETSLLIRINQNMGKSENTDDYIHFNEDETVSVNNGSLSIGPSAFSESIVDPIDESRIYQAWGREIWFFVPKKIGEKSTLELIGNQLATPQLKKQISEPLLLTGLNGAVQDSALAATNKFYRLFQYNPVTHLAGMGVAVGITEIAPELVKLLGKTYKDHYLLDAAMFPEVIYHEFFHILMGDKMGFAESSMVNEGAANYFAYVISFEKNLLSGGSKKDVKGYSPKAMLSAANLSYNLTMEQEEEAIFGSLAYSYFLKLHELDGSILLRYLGLERYEIGREFTLSLLAKNLSIYAKDILKNESLYQKIKTLNASMGL